MAPKPFPFPLGIGIDVCHINRIAAPLRQESLRNRWAQRVFTRLEWTGLCRRIQQANLLEEEPLSHAKKWMPDSGTSERNLDNEIWTLPDLSKHTRILESNDPIAYKSAIADERSRLGRLSRYFAGRWAAKEAAIKAHRHRRLYMHEVSIVSSPKSDKVIALIDPICNLIQMDEAVAALRGLRGFGPQSQGLHKGLLVSTDGEESTKVQKTGSKYFVRRRKIKETERQTAEINISHDGEYAVAVCMAFDSSSLHPEGRRIIDDGAGPALHEPQWGDEGWFHQDYMAKDDGWKDESMTDLLEGAKLEGAKTLIETEDYGNALKEALESQDDWRIPPLP